MARGDNNNNRTGGGRKSPFPPLKIYLIATTSPRVALVALRGVRPLPALAHVAATAQLKSPVLVALVRALVARAPQGGVVLAQLALALIGSRCAALKPALMSCA